MPFFARIPLLIVLLSISFRSLSQDQHQPIAIPFQPLTTEEGLISNKINCLARDSMGFYWYGTSLGLNRHDGSSLETFQHQDDDPYSLPENDIQRLIAVNAHIVAGLTAGGHVFLYDYRFPRYNSFIRIPLRADQTKPFVTREILGQGGHLYAINFNGDIMQINMEDHSGALLHQQPDPVVRDPNISIFRDSLIWIGADNGLFAFDLKDCAYTKMDLSGCLGDSTDQFSITLMVQDGPHHFYLGSTKVTSHPFKGLMRFHTSDFSCQKLDLKVLGNPMDMYHIDVLERIQGNTFFLRALEISSMVFKYDFDTGRHDPISISNHHRKKIHTISIICTSSEHNGKFRVGTNQGIFIHEPESYLFKEIYPQRSLYKSQHQTGLLHSGTGHLFIATTRVIQTYDLTIDTLIASVTFPQVQSHHIRTQQPNLIELDSNKILVISSYLMTYLIREKRFDLHEPDPAPEVPAAHKFHLFPFQKKGEIIFFFRDGTLFAFDPAKSALQALPLTDPEGQPVYIRATGCSFDSKGQLWVTSFDQGLMCLDTSLKQAMRWQGLEDAGILNDIYIDSADVAWIASSRQGLIEIPLNGSVPLAVKRHDTHDGYSNSELFQVIEDDYGHIWSTTGYGISYFEKHTGDVFNFSKPHGLEFPHNLFRGKTKDKAGNIYFSGGINIIKIDPSRFLKKTNPPAIYIRQFQINHKPVAAFWRDTSITLTHKQNNFAFDISVINHTHSNLNKIRYKLENYHTDWINLPAHQFIVPFNHLDPGHYTFRVIASNNEGVWNMSGINVNLHVLAAFHNTMWFRASIILFLVAIGYYILKQRTQRLLALQRVDIEKKIALESERTRISRDMHDDIGSGLSALYLQSHILKEKIDTSHPELSAHADIILRSSEELNQSIREIIWTVSSKYDSMTSLIQFTNRFCRDLGEKTNIAFALQTSDPPPLIELSGAKRKNIYLCIKEAVNNAIKHGRPEKIDITIREGKDQLITIEVRDNGKGMQGKSKEEILTGNGLRNMKDRMKELGGSVDFYSLPTGTTVTFEFIA